MAIFGITPYHDMLVTDEGQLSRNGAPMRKFWFTVTRSQHPQGPGCVEVTATDASKARELMHRHHGWSWAFQYDNFDQIHFLDQDIIERIDEVTQYGGRDLESDLKEDR